MTRRRAKQPPPCVWKLTDLGPNRLGVECPRCEGKAIVNRKRWFALLKKEGFPIKRCIYCSFPVSFPQSILKGR